MSDKKIAKADHATVSTLLQVIFECNYRMAVAIRNRAPAGEDGDEDKAEEMLQDSGNEAANICTRAIDELTGTLKQAFHLEECDIDKAAFQRRWKQYQSELYARQ